MWKIHILCWLCVIYGKFKMFSCFLASEDYVYLYAVMKGISGTARFDNLQLEEGDVGGRRNLVENNGFLCGEERFERSASLGSGDGVVDAQGLGAMPGGKVFAITGDPQTDKRITQTIQLKERPVSIPTTQALT